MLKTQEDIQLLQCLVHRVEQLRQGILRGQALGLGTPTVAGRVLRHRIGHQ